MRNTFFTHGTRNEQFLQQNLVEEYLKMFGMDVMYIPRQLVSQDSVFNEEIVSEFDDSYLIEAYMENFDGFQGGGDLLTKFGIRQSDEVTLVISQQRYTDLITQFLAADPQIQVPERPSEGDLIYFPLTSNYFEIKFVEHEEPFYQLGKNYVYKLKCELFEYSDEELNTGVADIDAIETTFANAITVNFAVGGTGDFTVGEVVAGGTSNVTAEVKAWDSANRQLQVYNRTGIFTIPETVTGQTSGAAWTSASYNTLNNVNSEVDQNYDFETQDDDILDFTEGNPFGTFASTTDTTI